MNVYITYAKRTPIGKIGGKLSHLRVDDMLATVFSDFKNNAQFDLNEIDDVISGCANQAGEDNRNLSRMSAVLAGIPFEVPATTINRLCGSSLDAIIDAWARIQSGLADAILVGGAESMTRGPYVLSKAQAGYDRDQKMYDTTFGWRFSNPKMEKMFPLLGMGETAEEVASQWKITREEQDLFALASHQKAVAAWKRGDFSNEVLPLEFQVKKDLIKMDSDECPREATTLEALAKLNPVFKKDGSVTAGNASPMNDGAACVFLCSEDFLKRHKLKPLVKITGAGVRGVHPNVMGIGPIEAVKVLMTKYKKKINDFDIVELNEAFAAQALACIKDLQIDLNRVNPNGGAIALGHPLGCSGARIVTTLTHQMQKNKNLKQGLATMCIGVGQGIALSVENC